MKLKLTKYKGKRRVSEGQRDRRIHVFDARGVQYSGSILLRASVTDDIVVPWTNQRIGDGTFSVAAQRAWKSDMPAYLPENKRKRDF